MTFIALPVVPDDPIGPFGGVNPREVWLIAIVLAGVSFLGYAAVKYFGERHGVLLAAAAGGLVSSTAVTLANARRAAAGEGAPQLLAAGVALATAVSFVRVLAIVAVLQAEPAGAARRRRLPRQRSLPSASRCSGSIGRPDKDGEQTDGEAPQSVRLLVGDRIGANHGRRSSWSAASSNNTFGSAGAIIGAAALGLFDVDAVTVSMAQLVPQPLSLRDGTFAILAAVASNTLSKLVIGAGRGPRPLRRSTSPLMSVAARRPPSGGAVAGIAMSRRVG